MNTNLKKLLSLVAVMALLAFGVAAIAETVDSTTTDAQTAQTETTTETTDDAAYQAALEQYQKARQENRLNDFKTELAEMVTNGQLTQEQADLLIERAEAQLSVANGVCPECGASLGNYGYGNGYGDNSGNGMMGGGKNGRR